MCRTPSLCLECEASYQQQLLVHPWRVTPDFSIDQWSLGGRSCRTQTLQLRYQAGYWRQLAVLSRRLAKATYVDPMLLAMNWGAALLMAIGLGVVYGHATRDTGEHPVPIQCLRRFASDFGLTLLQL